MEKKTFFLYYIEELRLRFLYYFLSLLWTWMILSTATYEFFYFFLVPYGRTYIFTESGEVFFQAFFLHFLLTFLWNLPYGIYQSFSFVNPRLYTSQKTFYIFFFVVFFFIYICLVFIFLWIGAHLFQFFLGHRIETGLLSIHAEIRVASISWNIYQCFFLPFPLLGLFSFFLYQGEECSRWYGWAFCILSFAWIFPPDFFIQLWGSIFLIFFYELGFWLYLLQKNKIVRIVQ